MDTFAGLDMQKDTIIQSFQSVLLDPTQSNIAIKVKDIQDVIINGQSLGLGGYLDIGLIDTMYDLIVNFIGAFVFSIFGFIYLKNEGQGRIVKHFIPYKKKFQDLKNRHKHKEHI